MLTELRRSTRHPDYLPLEIHVVDSATGNQLAGPYSGRIIDLSRHGARLLLTQVMQENHHIFYSTRENDAHLLQLIFEEPPEIIGSIIRAVPVWFDLCRNERITAFMMGIEFIPSSESKKIKQLFKVIERNQQHRSAWWNSNANFVQINSTTTKGKHPS
ncbi:MAG: hypothetical protein CSA34_02955 [Desulfobulbus propionicus]|nr:MAG: hypothetical protein CSA34_02955 [Desulfobulbus propionicus]